MPMDTKPTRRPYYVQQKSSSQPVPAQQRVRPPIPIPNPCAFSTTNLLCFVVLGFIWYQRSLDPVLQGNVATVVADSAPTVDAITEDNLEKAEKALLDAENAMAQEDMDDAEDDAKAVAALPVPVVDAAAVLSQNWPVLKTRPNCNSKKARRNMKHKTRTSMILSPLGLSPWSTALDAIKGDKGRAACTRHLETIVKAGRVIPFPVVVKPAAGVQGLGVTTGVKTLQGICDAVDTMVSGAAKTSNPTFKGSVKDFFHGSRKGQILVEQMVFGENYRVFVYRGRVIDVVRREMAFVVGDGTATLGNLIRRRNMAQKRAGLHKTHKISHDMIASRYSLKLGSVVERGKKVQITMVGNFHNGCNPFHVPPVVEILRNTFFFQIERAALHSYGPDPHSC